MLRRLLARRGPGTLAVALLSACLLHPAAVWAADETPSAPVRSADDATASAASKTFDALILRPTSLVVLIIGVGLFVPATIVSAAGGKTPFLEAWDRFVVQPASYMVARPLGDF